MKRAISIVLLFLLPLLAISQLKLGEINVKTAVNNDTFKNGKYTLILINSSSSFSPDDLNRLKKTFFTVYPKEVQAFNKKAVTTVTIYVDSVLTQVPAATLANVIHLNAVWLNQYPDDIDVITHEAMHVVQGYAGEAQNPGWLVEGIADYARYLFGVNNGPANWTLPAYNDRQKYTDAYRVTARFLAWLESHGYKGIVQKLDAVMRERKYSDAVWQKFTGKTVDELWDDYGKNPGITAPNS